MNDLYIITRYWSFISKTYFKIPQLATKYTIVILEPFSELNTDNINGNANDECECKELLVWSHTIMPMQNNRYNYITGLTKLDQRLITKSDVSKFVLQMSQI